MAPRIDQHEDPRLSNPGLAFAPKIEELAGMPAPRQWLMSPAEQVGLYYLLSTRRPHVGIEIGTRFGGSLAVFAAFCTHVYALDIDPTMPERLGDVHSNVTFVVGDSKVTLPRLTEQLAGSDIGLVLIDGDHSAVGVAADIKNVLQIRPLGPLYVLMHDSFNPSCRRGMESVSWASCPFVHTVELDFVPGVIHQSAEYLGQLWGGFALAILKPEEREGPLEITAGAGRTLVQLTKPRTIGTRVENRIRRMFGMKLTD